MLTRSLAAALSERCDGQRVRDESDGEQAVFGADDSQADTIHSD
jgi:hypothetical protein